LYKIKNSAVSLSVLEEGERENVNEGFSKTKIALKAEWLVK
jgi:hypothetical protein